MKTKLMALMVIAFFSTMIGIAFADETDDIAKRHEELVAKIMAGQQNPLISSSITVAPQPAPAPGIAIPPGDTRPVTPPLAPTPAPIEPPIVAPLPAPNPGIIIPPARDQILPNDAIMTPITNSMTGNITLTQTPAPGTSSTIPIVEGDNDAPVITVPVTPQPGLELGPITPPAPAPIPTPETNATIEVNVTRTVTTTDYVRDENRKLIEARITTTTYIGDDKKIKEVLQVEYFAEHRATNETWVFFGNGNTKEYTLISTTGKRVFGYDKIETTKLTYDGNGKPVTSAYESSEYAVINGMNKCTKASKSTATFTGDGELLPLNTVVSTYSYDQDGKLIETKIENATATYNENNKRTGLSMITSTFNADKKLIEQNDEIRKYDEDGNLVSATQLNSKFDASEKLTSKSGIVNITGNDGIPQIYTVQYDVDGNGSVTATHVYASDGHEVVNSWGAAYITPDNLVPILSAPSMDTRVPEIVTDVPPAAAINELKGAQPSAPAGTSFSSTMAASTIPVQGPEQGGQQSN